MTIETAALIISVLANAYLLRTMGQAWGAVRAGLDAAKRHEELSSFWKDVSLKFQSLVMAKETLKAILDGEENMAFEHPDPAQQGEANRMMADLRRLAQKLQTAEGLRTKGSDAAN